MYNFILEAKVSTNDYMKFAYEFFDINMFIIRKKISIHFASSLYIM